MNRRPYACRRSGCKGCPLGRLAELHRPTLVPELTNADRWQLFGIAVLLGAVLGTQVWP